MAGGTGADAIVDSEPEFVRVCEMGRGGVSEMGWGGTWGGSSCRFLSLLSPQTQYSGTPLFMATSTQK